MVVMVMVELIAVMVADKEVVPHQVKDIPTQQQCYQRDYINFIITKAVNDVVGTVINSVACSLPPCCSSVPPCNTASLFFI